MVQLKNVYETILKIASPKDKHEIKLSLRTLHNWKKNVE